MSTTLRPARVVVVIDGGVQWSYWARRALHRAGRIWGGGGYAVVPHQNGVVHPVLLRACAVFDPDFVVTFDPTVGDIEHFNPGSYRVRREDGSFVTGEELARLFEQAKGRAVPISADQVARDRVAAVCSTYQSNEHVRWHEHVTILGEEDGAHFPSVLDMPGTWSGSVLACPREWGGVLGALVASHAGVAAPPSRDAAEPPVSVEMRTAVASWVMGLAGAKPPDELLWHPNAAVGIDPAEAPTAHDRTMTHLDQIHAGHAYRQTGLLVLGDTAEDFALARLWRLTFGLAHWLPSVLGVDEDPMPWPIRWGIDRIVRELSRHVGTLRITSVSLSEAELGEVAERLGTDDLSPEPEPNAEPDARLQVVVARDLPWRQPVTVQLAVKEQWDTPVTVPVTVDESLTTAMAAPLPPPMLAHPELAARAEMNWHVDVQWPGGRAVRRRGLDSRELFGDRPTMMPTWARSSRFGTTYQAQRFDFVPAGIRPENRLARVVLRDLSLTGWLAAKGVEHGLTVRPSTAGQRAALLAGMLGGRQNYTQLFGGALLPALRAMLPTSATTSTAYPAHDGVALSAAEGVLSFDGMCARCPSVIPDEVRQHLDTTGAAGVVRRGLVLRCLTCEHKQFQTVDNLAQRWRCQRCEALNDLNRQAWKAPTDEPTWFYDLHPVGRHVLRDHGEVPALLSTHLRNQPATRGGQFDDVTEIELVKDGQPHVELDLVTYTDDTLSVAECKTSGNDLNGRAGRKEITKKCDAAAWLRADQLIFATTAENWTPASISTVQDTTRQYRWGPLGLPQIILISNLGTGDTATKVL